MSLRTLPTTLLLCTLLTGGCVWPHRQWDMANFSGRLVESSSGKPIPDVGISSTPWGGNRVDTRTDAAGEFTLLSQRNLHWFPFDRGIHVALEFKHPDYQPLIMQIGLGGISDRFDKQAPPTKNLGDIPLAAAQQD